jgi:hypothetical protein
MTIFVCLLLSIGASWYILSPIFSDSSFAEVSTADSNINILLDQKTRSVYMLRDLELDYSTGKLSEEEYKTLKDELSFELSEVIEKIDKN